MITNKPGFDYHVETTDKRQVPLSFCRKDETGQFVHGITNEELVLVLKDRFSFLAAQDDSPENVRNVVYINQIHLQLIQRQKNKPARKDR